MNRNYFTGDAVLVVKGEYKKHIGTVRKIYNKYNRVAIDLDTGKMVVLGRKEVALARKDKLD